MQNTVPERRTRHPAGRRQYLSSHGNGPSPTGDHPFLNRFNLDHAARPRRAFQLRRRSITKWWKRCSTLTRDTFFTRRESPTEPPNYYIRTAAGKLTAYTKFPDPQPIMRTVTKKLVTYKRPDGVEMSFTLYLPPDYQGRHAPAHRHLGLSATSTKMPPRQTRRPSPDRAMRFTEIGGYSEIFFALDGYAVLDNASMPIVGPRAR